MADGGEVIFKFLGDDKALKKTMSGLSSIAKTALAGMVAGTAAVAAGFTAIVTESVKARGEMEQLEGGAKKIFDEMDFKQLEEDARNAYRTMNMSASEYISMMNHVGATFAATMGDQRGYEVAKKGMQAIADYASGTGESISLLNEKYKLITRSATSYQSICDQFAGILPQTKKDFLQQAQAAGFLSTKYTDLTKVPLPEYQEALTNMLELSIDKMNLLGNTATETETTLTGSIAAMQASWQNFLSGYGDLGTVMDTSGVALDNVIRIIDEILPQLSEQLDKHMPDILKLVSKIVDMISESFDKYAPQITEISVQIIGIMAKAMIKSIPTILLAISDIIGELLLALTNANTKFFDVALTWLSDLATGVMEGVGKVLLAIADVLTKIFQKLMDFNDKIWQTAWDWIKKMAEGIRKGIETAVNAAKELIEKIKSIFTGIVDSAKNWGRDMIEGFANGIKEKMNAVKDSVGNLAGSIKSKLHFSRPDEGPLRDYETWMPDMIKGMTESLNRAKPMLLNEISNLAGAMSPVLNGNVNSIGPSVNVVVNSNFEQDPLGQIVSNIKTFSNGAKNDYNYGYGG